jgi:tetratricopeptide (TPR) repeat protein
MSKSDYYRRGVALAEAGRYQQGWDCLREYLRQAPQDVEALNDAGAILHCLSRTEEAIGLLTRARQLEGGNAQIVWNLAEAYLGGGRAVEAAGLFDDMERAGTLNLDVVNRTATLLIDQGNKSQALEVLLRSYRLWPGQKVLPPMLDVIRAQRPKVAFLCPGAGPDEVLVSVCAFVQQRFRTDLHAGNDPVGIAGLLRWSDIAWCAGGGAPLVEASRGRGPRLVAGIRRSEVRGHWASAVRWENVHVLALIGGEGVAEALLGEVPDLRERTRRVVVPSHPAERQWQSVNEILIQLEIEIGRQGQGPGCRGRGDDPVPGPPAGERVRHA